jgi:hypothetical protein
MKKINLMATGLMFPLLVLFALAGAQAGNKLAQEQQGIKKQGVEQDQLDPRIEQWVKKTCGNDVACSEQKRAYYIERMKQYQQRVQEKCGDDQACRNEMRAKYMQRRAKTSARIAEHCGDDKACEEKLREEYRQAMDAARKKCGDDKACWEKFYKDKKPG